MKPVQPVACNYYGIRKPRLHPPIINHELGEQMVQYCLIKILNEDNHETTLNKNNIYSQSFFTFKVTLKINILQVNLQVFYWSLAIGHYDQISVWDFHFCHIKQW